MQIFMKTAVEIDMDPQKEQHIEDRLSRRKCITPDCDSTVKSRGLCDACLSQFKTVRQSKPVGKPRDDWEQKAITAGMVLASGQQRRLSPSDNPFAHVG